MNLALANNPALVGRRNQLTDVLKRSSQNQMLKSSSPLKREPKEIDSQNITNNLSDIVKRIPIVKFNFQGNLTANSHYDNIATSNLAIYVRGNLELRDGELKQSNFDSHLEGNLNVDIKEIAKYSADGSLTISIDKTNYKNPDIQKSFHHDFKIEQEEFSLIHSSKKDITPVNPQSHLKARLDGDFQYDFDVGVNVKELARAGKYISEHRAEITQSIQRHTKNAVEEYLNNVDLS